MTQLSRLTPMLVQYLVGLCCLRWEPEAIDITIGDMVLDESAEKERDVDVTVTVSESETSKLAFKAYEVKREGTPQDVTEVEQLWAKLNDMPSLTHRAIVSSSGYTDGAKKKAASHSVDLYELKPWTSPLQEQFPALTMQGTAQECFRGAQYLLCWVQPTYSLITPTAKDAYTVNPGDALFSDDGSPHPTYRTFAEYQHELLLRSTEVLLSLEPATTVLRTFPVPFDSPGAGVQAGPAWPHTHTLDVSSDRVFVQSSQGRHHLVGVTINGFLQWQRGAPPLYYVMQKVSDGTAFAGALMHTEARDGHMTALVFSPKTREIGVHFVRLPDKHKNLIRKLKLEFDRPPT